ncbi:unnamed protein product, partial [Aphanomyces euteiches]
PTVALHGPTGFRTAIWSVRTLMKPSRWTHATSNSCTKAKTRVRTLRTTCCHSSLLSSLSKTLSVA